MRSLYGIADQTPSIKCARPTTVTGQSFWTVHSENELLLQRQSAELSLRYSMLTVLTSMISFLQLLVAVMLGMISNHLPRCNSKTCRLLCWRWLTPAEPDAATRMQPTFCLLFQACDLLHGLVSAEADSRTWISLCRCSLHLATICVHWKEWNVPHIRL